MGISLFFLATAPCRLPSAYCLLENGVPPAESESREPCGNGLRVS
jgi:hypothetical protein